MSVPKVQVPSMYMAALPLAKTAESEGLASFTSREAGVDMKFWITWNSFRPAREAAESRSPYHVPPFSTAICPPSAHTMGMAAYHSSPGR